MSVEEKSSPRRYLSETRDGRQVYRCEFIVIKVDCSEGRRAGDPRFCVRPRPEKDVAFVSLGRFVIVMLCKPLAFSTYRFSKTGG